VVQERKVFTKNPYTFFIPRNTVIYIAVNCGAILKVYRRELIWSRKGHSRDNKFLFERVQGITDGGTIFLDEVG
jgi:DNA-binding NtrC family response regulator